MRFASLPRAVLTAVRSSVPVFAAILSFSQPSFAQIDTSILPADRATVWNPGMMAVGGIPVRSTVCATVRPLGGGQDDTANIQAAVNGCPAGQVVQLAAGTFTINNGNYVLINKGITLRGAGPGQTTLQKTDGAKPDNENVGPNPSPLIIVGPARYSSTSDGSGVAASTNLTVDAAKGAYTVTVASTAGFSPGQIVLLDEASGAGWQTDPAGRGQIWASPDFRVVWQKHNPALTGTDDFAANQYPTTPGSAGQWFSRLDRPTAEVKQIASISGSSITFTTPIHISYRTSHTAQLSYYGQPHVTNAGVENLTMTGGDNGNLRFEWAAMSWAKNVENTVWHDEGFAIDSSFRIELREFYVHDAAWAEPGGGGYAISLANGTSEVLIENGISVRANKVIVARCSGAGSVVGYNYMDMGYINTNGKWIEIGLNASHMVGPHHVLFEGNYGFNGDSDKTHGNSIYHTYFRNHLRGIRAPFNNQAGGALIDDASNQPQPDQGPNGPVRAAGMTTYSYWMSFVGNVLGAAGQMSGWVYETTFANGAPGIWMLGWDDWSPYPVDAKVAQTVLRHGNFDYVTNAVNWDPTISNHSLPNSFYLPQRPAFFNAAPGYTWPWVDPLGATKIYTLPAKARYDAGTPFRQPSLKPPVAHDFNGDGLSDVAWRDTSGNAAAWLMNGAQLVQSAPYGTVPTAWSIVGQRDFNGDGMADWLWRDTSGNVAIWFLNGAQLSQSAGVGNVAKAWSVAGTGDFDGDGKGDVLWQDTSGNVAVWFMNGAQATPAGVGAASSGWSIAGTGDFNGDGKSDILWQDNSGNVAIWFMNGVQVTPAGVGAVSTAWSIVGTGDFNGDGKSDILFRDASGNVAIWFMNGVQVTPAGVGAVSTAWSVAETGDYDGDGKSDILWQDTSGNVAVWFMNGAQVTPAGVGAVPTAWSIQGKGAD
ncbi:MAG TPA: FG-GAP-like repeat-containing protein [Xanthobacteraceae bacterium]|jgi:hypothetical protein|nr:FG-GAP-like repeat-containing protein [Xanthobacteraceae bacterium]